jgi:hypothetical protein
MSSDSFQADLLNALEQLHQAREEEKIASVELTLEVSLIEFKHCCLR